MTESGDERDQPERGDELLGYFFPMPAPKDRVRSALRRIGEVVLVLVGVAGVTLVLRQGWVGLDAAWCAWRLNSMAAAVLDGAAVTEDLDVARAAVSDHHPILRQPDAESAWTRRLKEVHRAMASGGTAWDLFEELGPAVASVGCGHTMLLPPEGWINLLARGGRVLPLEIRFFGQRGFVVAHYASDVEVPVGAEVLAIDGTPMARIRERLVRSTPSDGPGRVHAEALVDQAFFFHYARWFGIAARHRLRWRASEESKPVETEVRSGLGGSVGARHWERFPERHPRHPPFPVQAKVMPETGVAYLWVPTFSLERARNWREHLHRFFERVEEHGVHTLVLDLRANAGGPSPLAVELVEYLVAEPFVYLRDPTEPEFAGLPVFQHFARVIMPHSDTVFRGELFVLVDGGSFSTTGHLCAVLREHRRVHFVGQEAGGGATWWDNPVTVELPNSRLRLQVARTTFAVAADDAAIVPGVELGPTLDDVLEGRDTALAELGRWLGADLEGARDALAESVSVIPEE
jgi:hypothetical protein